MLSDPSKQAKVGGGPSAVSTSIPGNGNSRTDFVGTGRLSSSVLDVDGRKTYVLDSSPGVPLVYVVAAAGVDLERYKGKQVNIYGTTSTRKDLSKPLAVATSAEIAQ